MNSERKSNPTDLRWYQYASFFQMMGIGFLNLFPLFWHKDLGFSKETVGYLNSFAIGVTLLVPLLFGWIGGRINPARILIVCFWGSALTAPLFLLLPDVIAQGGFFTVLQFFRAGYFTLVPVGVLFMMRNSAREGQKDSSGDLYGRYRRVGSVGFLAGSVLAGYAAQYLGNAAVPLITGLALFLAGVPFFRRLSIPVLKEKENKVRWKDVLQVQGIKPFMIGSFFAHLWWAGAFVFLPLQITALGAPESWVGWALSLCGLTAALSMRFTGKLVDHFGAARLIVLSTYASALRLLLMGLAPDPKWFFFIQLLHIPGWVLFDVCQISWIRHRAPGHMFSSVQGLNQVVTSMSYAASAGIMGFLVDMSSLTTAFMLASILPLLAIPFFLKIPRVKS